MTLALLVLWRAYVVRREAQEAQVGQRDPELVRLAAMLEDLAHCVEDLAHARDGPRRRLRLRASGAVRRYPMRQGK